MFYKRFQNNMTMKTKDNFRRYRNRKPNTMLKIFSYLGIFLAFTVFILMVYVTHLLVTSPKFRYPLYHGLGLGTKRPRIVTGTSDWVEDYLYIDLIDDSEGPEILHALHTQREKIKNEMFGYEFPNGRYNNNARSLEDLVPELGGKPIRNIVVTTWRSGSSFLGDILNSHPASYYHYEPLLDFGVFQIRKPPNATKALKILSALLNCNYSGLDRYLEYRKHELWAIIENQRLWEQCQQHPIICWMPEFLNPFCKLFPIQIMKVVRLRLRFFEKLLDDKRLNVRVLLLVRDPRGTLQSRKRREWCRGNSDCDQAEKLCADLVSDYSAAVRLTEKFPNRFLAIRYEDLSRDPFNYTKQLFRFYCLHFHQNVFLFLDTHTQKDIGGASSTYRNSKQTPFHWREELSHHEVNHIQNKCGLAMKYWGYVKANNASHQRFFNPITDFKLN